MTEFSFVRCCADRGDLSPYKTLSIMTYELAAIIQCASIGTNESRSHARDEVADYISMFRMACELLGLDYAALQPDDKCRQHLKQAYSK